ncbi:MAG: hypothetical protein OWS03_02890 [Alicyclobacillaceae bacterium]|nr:hypothetical protein [Alicyclobacillaceae bacterium]
MGWWLRLVLGAAQKIDPANPWCAANAGDLSDGIAFLGHVTGWW